MGSQYQTGVSTGILPDKMELEKLLVFEPDVIEFYNYSTPETALVKKFCRQHGIRASLHTPTPYDEKTPLRRFCPTGPDRGETMLAIQLTLNTIRLAAEMDAAGVVVHFPSPYADAPPHITRDHIQFFFDPVAALADDLKVNVLIENMTPHPSFHSPSDYLGIVSAYPHLGICFDAGHAFMLGAGNAVQQFLDTLAGHIGSVHLYGLVKQDAGFTRGMLQPSGRLPAGTDTLDTEAVIRKIKELGIDPLFILEYPVCEDEQMQEAAMTMRYLRTLLSQAP